MTNEDRFEAHFANPNENELSARLEAITKQQWQNSFESSDALGRITVSTPQTQPKPLKRKREVRRSPTIVGELNLKKRLLEPASKTIPKLDPAQRTLAPFIFDYQDVLLAGRTPQNAHSIRNIAVLHALNHLNKTRDRVIRNNEKLLAAAQNDGGKEVPDTRDQGFTRPKVLILLETRSACVNYVDSMVELCAPDQQENRKRFDDAFVIEEEKYGPDKPEDFQELFEGNDDNDFRLGLKFTRKTMKFYSQFYNSDIIFASPLGLRRAIKADDPKKQDYDSLSSIEILIIDQADAMLMQNFDHVTSAFAHLNQQPRNAAHTDFSRVRQYYLDNHARHLRQTIIFSAYLTPELNALHTSHMQNVAGKVKISSLYKGSISDIELPLHQTFSRFTSSAPTTEPDNRFAYFTSTIVPSLNKLPEASAEDGGRGGHGILLFIPSYLDFVRVRNYLDTSPSAQNIPFGAISEYSDLSEARRARSHFQTGRHAVLLYTGRAHHFRRYRIRGVKKVVMYGVPENPVFYSEIAGGFLQRTVEEGEIHAEDASVRVLFSRWDSLALERVVGSKRVQRMLKESGGDTFDFR